MLKKMNALKKNKKGFTLAELLIVVAIIAVLVAIAIPIFTTQLERAREATDLANIRAAYAEACTAALTSADGTGSATSVAMTQTTAGWGQITDAEIGGKYAAPSVSKGDIVTVTVAADGTVTIA